MTRVVSSKNREGARKLFGNFSGRKSVRRLFARDPLGRTADWGKGVMDSVGSAKQTENTVGGVNPKVTSAPANLDARTGKLHVADRSANRRVKRS